MANPPSPEVDAYIDAAPEAARPLLRELRALIRETVPEARESISYRMPYYSHLGRLVYFAAFEHHVGLYATAAADRYAPELKRYMSGKSTLHFAIGEALPVAGIRKLLEARVRENEERQATRKSRR